MHPRNEATPQQLTQRLGQLYEQMGLSTQQARDSVSADFPGYTAAYYAK